MNDPIRPSSAALLKEATETPRLTVYLASAPGAGKTRRLLEDAHRALAAGTRVVVGWVDTKGRPDLDRLLAALPRIDARTGRIGEAEFTDFDFAATLAARPQLVVLDELAHANLAGGAHAKRWQDAQALRAAGISVLGALNIQHVETVAATAERIIGFPVREIVPLSFLRDADDVIALDVAPEQFEARLRSGHVVHPDDAERALGGLYRPSNLRLLREMMLRTIDDLTEPGLGPNKTSIALALVTEEVDAGTFAAKTAAIAQALDLAPAIAAAPGAQIEGLSRIADENDARVVTLPPCGHAKLRIADIRAAFIAVPFGALAKRIAAEPIDRDIFVVDSSTHELAEPSDASIRAAPFAQTVGDRMRIGYGRLTVYVGAAAGSGKTFAMLDRAHQLSESGVDVVAAFVETHKRAETEAKVTGLELLGRRELCVGGIKYQELDVEELLERHPAVALIDELAHTNAPESTHAKRYDDVLTILRAGISVMTTVNVQHLEGLSDAVFRLTGQRVRETVPDAILEIADDIVLIDTTPETLRERLRAGKIYPRERVETALANFFRFENLAALRELVLREVMRARTGPRPRAPFSRLLLGVKERERDVGLIERCARFASRLDIEFSVGHVRRARGESNERALAILEAAARRARARWIVVTNDDPLAALLQIARDERATTIAVEGARTKTRWPAGTTFARRLLDHGTRQLLILGPDV
ncbi:MAG: hypothetical protein ABI346_10130 [Candidatus Baltobacteraceae bacterium]